jgi:hypothetical protein
LVAPREGPSYINGCPFERGPDVLQMHLAQSPGSGATTGSTVVALLEPLLNIVSYLEPVVHFPNFIQGLVDTQVTS